MTFWTHYWTRDSAEGSEANAKFNVMDHTAGNQFRARGVSPGDTVYVISLSSGALRILGRLKVDRVVGIDEARATLPYESWVADDHLLADARTATPVRYDAEVPPDKLDDIEFVTSKGTRGIARNRRGLPDPQTFRSVREITAATARLFDAVLGLP